jgi:hypothetical protein
LAPDHLSVYHLHEDSFRPNERPIDFMHEMVQNRTPAIRRLKPLSQRGLAGGIHWSGDANTAPEMQEFPTRNPRMPVLQQSVLGVSRETSRSHGCPTDLAAEPRTSRDLCARPSGETARRKADPPMPVGGWPGQRGLDGW